MEYSNFTIWLLIEVLLCGFGIPWFITAIDQKIRKGRREKIKAAGITDFKKKFSEFDENNPHYDVLCRNEDLRQNYFQHKEQDGQFVIPFPESQKDELKKYGFHPAKLYGGEMRCKGIGKKIFGQLKELLVLNGIPENEVEAFITKIAVDTSKKFITDIQGGNVRFNKYLYGVYERPKQTDKGCTINVYETDYFTFKTTTNIYNALKKLNGHVELNNHYAPFLNSIGVGGFVIVNRGEEDELIWGYRGSNCQSGGYWHFSYDETFTHDDAENQDQAATLSACIKRALDEELGINRNEDEKCLPESQITIIDGGVIHTDGKDNRYEFELCSFVRVCFSESYTFDDFIQNYRFAKDAELETRCLKLVKISEVDKFIEEEEKKGRISPESKALAMKIKCLADLKILPTDDEGFHELFPLVKI